MPDGRPPVLPRLPDTRAVRLRGFLVLWLSLILVAGAQAQLTLDRYIQGPGTNAPLVGGGSLQSTNQWVNSGLTNITGVSVFISLTGVEFDEIFIGETDAYLFYLSPSTNSSALVYDFDSDNFDTSLFAEFPVSLGPISNPSPGGTNTWILDFETEVGSGGQATLDYWRLIVTGDAATNGTISVGQQGIISGSDGYTVTATIDAGTGTGTNAVTAFVTNGQSLNFDGGISGTGELAKTGGGILAIGAASTGFSGTVNIIEGRLTLTNGGSLSTTSSVNLSGAAGVYDISAITAAGETNASLAGVAGSSVVLGGKNLSVGGNNADSAFAGVLSGSGGSLAKTGTGTMTLTGDNTYTGGTLISGGVLQVGNGGGTGSLGSGNITNNASLVIDRTGALTMAQTISGTGQVTKTGAGTLVLSVANSYSGGTTLEQGTLRVGHDTSLGTGGLTLNGGTLASSGGTAHTLANNVTMGGNAQFGDSTGTGNLTLTGTVDLGAATRTLTISNTKTRIDGVVSGTGGLTANGTGTLRLNAANTYSGTTTIAGGTLLVTDQNALGTGNLVQNSGTLLQISTTGTITNTMSLYNVSFTESVTLTGAKTLNNATITVETGDTVTEQGVLSGTGGLTKEGGGEYVLNGSADNTYEGATVVNAGSLVLSNSSGDAIHSSSGITVNSGGTLVLGASNQIGDGIGLTLNGGTFLVGASALTEKLGTLTLSSSSTLDFGVFETPGERIITFDNSFGIEWTGTLTITNWQGVAQTSSELTRLVFGVDGLDNDQLGQIVFASQGITGGELIGGGELVPVPEPRVYAAAVALLAVVGWRERKRLRDLLGKVKLRRSQEL